MCVALSTVCRFLHYHTISSDNASFLRSRLERAKFGSLGCTLRTQPGARTRDGRRAAPPSENDGSHCPGRSLQVDHLLLHTLARPLTPSVTATFTSPTDVPNPTRLRVRLCVLCWRACAAVRAGAPVLSQFMRCAAVFRSHSRVPYVAARAGSPLLVSTVTLVCGCACWRVCSRSLCAALPSSVPIPRLPILPGVLAPLSSLLALTVR